MLLFDFDGVLLDSLDEVVLTSYSAVSDELPESLSEVPRDFVDLFKLNRFHCGRAGDFLCLATGINIGLLPVSPPYYTAREFETLKSISSLDTKQRTESFFSTRQSLQEKSPNSWLNAHRPFQPIWEELTFYSSGIILLTNKDADSVKKTCLHFGLEVSEENIYSGDKGVSKSENFEKIKTRFPEVRDFHFVDDSVKNLENLERDFPGELSFSLASWGYNGPEDSEKAAALGFEIETQDSLIERLDLHM